MKVSTSGLRQDSPAKPLLLGLFSYQGITDAAGAASGLTLVCGDLANEPSYRGHLVKLLSGAAAGQTRHIDSHVAGTTTLIVNEPFTDNAGAVVPVVATTLFVILSLYTDEGVPLYGGTTTAAGQLDGKTMVDTGLAVPFTVDDEPIGHTVRITNSTTASLIGQERQIYAYDFGTSVLYFDTAFTAQVPITTTYEVLRDRPEGGGGSPGPSPEPTVEEVDWKLADKDIFDVAEATADTLRWSSEYQLGAADGVADINTTTPSALYVQVLAALALAACQYGTRRLYPSYARKFFTLTDADITATNEDVNPVWAGLAASGGVAWDANNYIAIYKRQSNTVEQICVESNIAGAGAAIQVILATTQDAVAFKIERQDTIWRCYYSLVQAPRHYWILAAEIEDATNAMTDRTSIYLTAYNPEDAVGQEIECDFHLWEYYETLGNLGDILQKLQGSVIAQGTFTTSSLTVPADTGRAEGNQFFKGCILMPIAGAIAYQPRPIRAFTTVTGVFGLDEPFTVLPGLVDYVILASDYPTQRLIDIFNLVNAMLVTTETGGTITTDGGVQDVYINNAPAGVFEPLKVMVDLSGMTVAETVVLRTYYRIAPSPATMKQKDQVVFQGVQGLPLKNIELEPNRYGIQVTLECTIGGPINIPWASFYRG